MKFLIVGATGLTGQELVKQALAADNDVTVLVRSPEKMADLVGENKLEVVEGSIFEADDVRKAMTGCDAVFSAVGGRPGMFIPCDVYSRSADVILEVMKELTIKRFITCTAWGTKDDPRLGFLYRYVLKPTLFRNVNANMGVMEENLLTQGEDINWTVVKPSMLTRKPLSGIPVQTAEGYMCPGPGSAMISRADLAKFMLDCLHTTDWDRKLVAVKGGVASPPAPQPPPPPPEQEQEQAEQ